MRRKLSSESSVQISGFSPWVFAITKRFLFFPGAGRRYPIMPMTPLARCRWWYLIDAVNLNDFNVVCGCEGALSLSKSQMGFTMFNLFFSILNSNMLQPYFFCDIESNCFYVEGSRRETIRLMHGWSRLLMPLKIFPIRDFEQNWCQTVKTPKQKGRAGLPFHSALSS